MSLNRSIAYADFISLSMLFVLGLLFFRVLTPFIVLSLFGAEYKNNDVLKSKKYAYFATALNIIAMALMLGMYAIFLYFFFNLYNYHASGNIPYNVAVGWTVIWVVIITIIFKVIYDYVIFHLIWQKIIRYEAHVARIIFKIYKITDEVDTDENKLKKAYSIQRALMILLHFVNVSVAMYSYWVIRLNINFLH